jgi:hypothetical protein
MGIISKNHDALQAAGIIQEIANSNQRTYFYREYLRILNDGVEGNAG